MSDSASDLDAVVGANVRRIRERLGATQDELAQFLRDRGWNDASGVMLVDLERGARKVGLAEVFVLADALNVPVVQLLENDGMLRITSSGGVADSSRGLAERFTHRVDWPKNPATWEELQRLRRLGQFSAGLSAGTRHSIGDETRREAERYAARRLGLTAEQVVRRSYALWGQTLSEERDARVAARVEGDATPRQRAVLRGHVTRGLLAELQKKRRQK